MRSWKEPAALRRAVVATGGLAALWVTLAWLRPQVTFHLAPALVAGALPAVYGRSAEEPAPPETALVLAAVGEAIGMLLALVLWALGKLLGPSLLPVGGALLEAVLAASLGAVVGWVVGAWRSWAGGGRGS